MPPPTVNGRKSKTFRRQSFKIQHCKRAQRRCALFYVITFIPMTRQLIKRIKACTLCAEHLPFPPKPVFSFSAKSKILLVGQAPGMKVQQSGKPWTDASGERLRDWLGVSEAQFYDTDNFAIVPMGFCYPGKKNKSDAPPRPECAPQWMPPILKSLRSKQLTLLIGQYAFRHFLGTNARPTLTESLKEWRSYQPEFLLMPHPSPRNNIWLRKNPWFEDENLPNIKKKIALALRNQQ